MKKMVLLLFIYLNACVFQFLSCSRTNEKHNLATETQLTGIKVVSADLSELQNKIIGDTNSLIFITTEWCKGGALTFQSYIHPYIQNNDNANLEYYILYFGSELRDEFVSESDSFVRPVTINKIDDSLFENAFVHKMRIESFLSELDPNYKFLNSIPVTVRYDKARLENISPSKLEMQVGEQ